ncbi:MAG: hypothetical protein WCF18_04305 [Chthoniobacteraceae bacterium]
MTADPLPIALTFDAEADVFDRSFGGEPSKQTPSWRGIEEGIPRIDEVLAGYHDSTGARACATWYVRGDRHIGALFGSSSHLLEKYRDLWQQRASSGDEIGFHPHLYRLTGGEWRQETDSTALREQLTEVLAAMRAAGFAPRSSRIGEAFGSNEVMAALDELGLQCDSTAMPGRVRRDAERQLDWAPTPQSPYHPSIADYRQPGTPELRLLQVPMSMIETKAEYDRAPLLRYADLSFHHEVMRAGLTAFLTTAPLLVTVTHPSTVLPGIAPQRHGLLSFDIGNFRRNLDFILAECERLARGYRFITIGECAHRFATNHVA